MANKKRIGLFIKSVLDRITALTGLLIISPLFFFVAIILKWQKQDVFYLQKRVGHRGRDFFVYKFTTMPKGSEKFGYITTTSDARPFKFGKFLRKTKINELPQLLNVALGNMSIVGPRPLVREQIASVLSEAEIEQYYQMQPGITGAGSLFYHHEDHLLAQVPEPFKYDREVIMPHKQALEYRYAESWNLKLDLRIVFMTSLTVLYKHLDITEDLIFGVKASERLQRKA